jgi:hypothetical protein
VLATPGSSLGAHVTQNCWLLASPKAASRVLATLGPSLCALVTRNRSPPSYSLVVPLGFVHINADIETYKNIKNNQSMIKKLCASHQEIKAIAE